MIITWSYEAKDSSLNRKKGGAALQHDKYPGGLSFTSYSFFLIIALKWEFPAFVKHQPWVEIRITLQALNQGWSRPILWAAT